MKRLFLWTTFFTCWLTASKTLYLHHGIKGDSVTLFFGLLHGFSNLNLYKGILIATTILHFFTLIKWRRLAFPTFFLWILACSLHLENVTGFDHNLILPTQFLYLSFLSLFFWKEKMPKWLYTLQLFFLVIHYFGAGITKIWESGFSWIDGATFQMSLFVYSNPDLWLTKFFIENHKLSTLAQALILFVELLSPLILLKIPIMNRLFACCLIIFHLINEYFFHYEFWPSLIFVALSLLIFDKRLEEKSSLPV